MLGKQSCTAPLWPGDALSGLFFTPTTQPAPLVTGLYCCLSDFLLSVGLILIGLHFQLFFSSSGRIIKIKSCPPCSSLFTVATPAEHVNLRSSAGRAYSLWSVWRLVVKHYIIQNALNCPEWGGNMSRSSSWWTLAVFHHKFAKFELDLATACLIPILQGKLWTGNWQGVGGINLRYPQLGLKALYKSLGFLDFREMQLALLPSVDQAGKFNR